MNAKVIVLIAVFAAAMVSGSAYAGTSKSEALAACKDHIASQHDAQDMRRKVKKIKSRAGKIEIKVKVSAAGERFNAVCNFAKNGEMTYTTDRVALAGSDR